MVTISLIRKLDAKMLALKQPFVGIDVTVKCVVQYKLFDIRRHKRLYSRVIKSSYTAKFSDDVIGVMRLKDANEGAARKNITILLHDLYRLRIKNGIKI